MEIFNEILQNLANNFDFSYCIVVNVPDFSIDFIYIAALLSERDHASLTPL